MPTETEMLKDIWQKMLIFDTLLSSVQAVVKRVDDIEEKLKHLATHHTDLHNGFAYMETQMEEISTAITTKASTDE